MPVPFCNWNKFLWVLHTRLIYKGFFLQHIPWRNASQPDQQYPIAQIQ